MDTEEEIVVKSLDMGVDEYLKKPFNLPEIRAYLDAVQRRAEKVDLEKTYDIRGIRFCYNQSALEYENRIIRLTSIEKKLLKSLYDYRSQVVSYSILKNEIWGYHGYDKNKNALQFHIKILRKKLKLFGLENVIITYPQVGYKFDI